MRSRGAASDGRVGSRDVSKRRDARKAVRVSREGEHRYYQLLSLYEKQVLLAHTKGYEIEEIATYYDKSIQSVKNALSRCRTKFND